ncbi:HNH endonuclease [Streptomyces kurssanovii]|uniref:HNH endonuclease signature motif containing protein n=1 Tax=Streptomyces kurssanovii TaxID=67312 RepID=A0ABV3HZJ3_9ACTN
MRAALNRVGSGVCRSCRRESLAIDLHVDHVVPLSKNGMDIESNVQVLCRECHRLKTRSERGGGGRPL